MSGKPYTMKEMKAIVDYLTEHNGYAEIRGRKMWMDLASSKIINRTWQSMKETFLKRVLPDIHNPYYKLSLHQISSFTKGYDTEARLKNKLQIQPVSPETNKNGDAEQNMDAPGKSNEKGEDKLSGEELIQSNLRASTETLVLDNCYETAEDIRKDLLSSEEGDEDKQNKSPTKSLRELIIYSEPLTPMLQGVIDDFGTDEDADEPKMQIVEHQEPTKKNNDNNDENTAIEISDSEGNEMHESLVESSKNDSNEPSSLTKSDFLNVSKSKSNIAEIVANKSIDEKETSKQHDETDKIKTAAIVIHDDTLKSSNQVTQNTSETDSLLPANQEALNENCKSMSNKTGGKKRSASQEPQAVTRKKKSSKEKSVSDTEIKSMIAEKVSIMSKIAELKKIAAVDTIETHLEKNGQGEISKEDKKHDESITKIQEDTNKNGSSEIENPCLTSVSLYDEQFSNTKYTDSESHVEDEKKAGDDNTKRDDSCAQRDDNRTETKDDNSRAETKDDNNKKNDDSEGSNKIKKVESSTASIKKKNDVVSDNVYDRVLIQSHSDSVNDKAKPMKQKNEPNSVKEQRNRTLANVFGFSSGSLNRIRRRRIDYRKRSQSRQRHISDSSEWTSDTGSEYVSSPPRQYARKDRRNRKYLKPKSARILSLEEEGGLFVMYRKKIYPIVKDGKIVKNYTTFREEDDDVQKESYWKLKYVEEKKRTAELTKLLDEARDKHVLEEPGRVPVLPTLQNARTPEIQQQCQEPSKRVSDYKLPEQTTDNNMDTSQNPKTVKIKFTKNNEEVQLEGHWTHVNPVLAQVVQLFQKEEQPAAPSPATTPAGPAPAPAVPPAVAAVPATADTLQPDASASGKSTPIEEVVEKVNKRESEIAKEIEKYYEEEENPTANNTITENNVTKRRGRPKKLLSSVESTRSSKRAKLGTPEHSAGTYEKAGSIMESENSDQPIATRRTTRTPKKTTDIKETPTVRTRRSTTRQSKENVDVPKESSIQTTLDDDDSIRYKFPASTATTRRSYTNTKSNKLTNNTNQRKSKSVTNRKANSKDDNISLSSVQSSQSEQDFDNNRKQNTYNISKSPNQPFIQNISIPYLTDDASSQSSNSFQACPLHSMTFHNSTIKSDVYKSESYQFLMNKNSSLHAQNNYNLEKIEETTPVCNIDTLEMGTKVVPNSKITDTDCLKELSEEVSYPKNTDFDSSCNISLPSSPVLSIVENISINKTLLNSADDILNNDRLHDCVHTDATTLKEVLKHTVDASMPLMEQECGIETCCYDGMEYHYNLSNSETAVSESLVNKINTVTIQDKTLSDTLNYKLRDLLLESSKKNNKNKQSKKPDINKTKTKKRSSTPRKRQRAKKLILANTEQCIEEEHMESCSYMGRKSCAPVITISEENDTIDLNISSQIVTTIEKPNRRNKKETIKVKIAKPKSKKAKELSFKNCIKEMNDKTLMDSGFNNTECEAILQDINDSVDLIHNHSETCLSARDCLGDSIQIVENLAKSVISLNSTQSHKVVGINKFGNTIDNLTQELFSSDAQDGCDTDKEIADFLPADYDTASMYHTSQTSLSTPNSMITEDLSDEVAQNPTPKKRWYLLSEDENSNTNHCIDFNAREPGMSFGARLDQIFPITCAVPNLSDITEMSKE